MLPIKIMNIFDDVLSQLLSCKHKNVSMLAMFNIAQNPDI